MAKDLLDEEQKLQDKVFDLYKPIVICNKIDDLHNLFGASKVSYAVLKIVNLGIELIKNTSDFEKRLNE